MANSLEHQGTPSTTGSTARGVLAGAGAGALWGLVFLAPELAGEFGPLQLSIGRYLCYGVASVALIAPRLRNVLAALNRRDWLSLTWLALTGNIVYYIFLAAAVQSGGAALTSLVLGFLPVLVTVIGSRDHGAVPLTRLMPSLILCVAGGLCIGWQALAAPAASSAADRLLGLAYAICALASWTTFAVANVRCLSRTRVSVHEWNLLTGLLTGALAALLIPVSIIMDDWDRPGDEWLLLAGTSAGVALLASILGNALWNRASRLLPLTLVGQMILFETLFALLYAFAWEGRLPTIPEVGAFGLVTAGVISCLSAHRSPSPA